jgi:hypothetical protein
MLDQRRPIRRERLRTRGFILKPSSAKYKKNVGTRTRKRSSAGFAANSTPIVSLRDRRELRIKNSYQLYIRTACVVQH